MRKISILFFIVFPLFVSCPYGIFDLLKPNNSTINAYINGKELYSTGYEGNIYKINIDENPHDYLVLIAQHYKDEVIRDFPFTWVSDTITFQTIGYNSNSIGVEITNKLEPGLHTITARSSVSDELSKTFKLYVVSETNTISAKYNISDDFVPLEGVDYTNLLSGEVTTSTRQISLMYGYRYIFSITQAEVNSMDNYTFSCADNVNENGETVVYWDYNGMEYSLVVSSNVFDINHKPRATITHNQSNLSLSFSIDIKTIIGTDITEIENITNGNLGQSIIEYAAQSISDVSDTIVNQKNSGVNRKYAQNTNNNTNSVDYGRNSFGDEDEQYLQAVTNLAA